MSKKKTKNRTPNRLSEPDGFDPDELPDSLAIDFDLNYDVNLAERNPFQISAVALITKLVQKTLTIQIKVCKVRDGHIYQIW